VRLTHRLAVDPRGADERAAREVRRTGLASVNHADEKIDRRLTGDVVVLIHAGPIGVV